MTDRTRNEVETVDPRDVCLRHEVNDQARFEALRAAMEEDGWQGRPVIVYEWDGELRNITGCHRITAAMLAGLREIPALVIRPTEDTIDMVEFAAADDDWGAMGTLRLAGYDEAAALMQAEIDAQDN